MKQETLVTIKRRKKRGGRKGPPVRLGRSEYLARRLSPGSPQWRFYDLGTRLQSSAEPSDYSYAGRDPSDTTPPVMDGSQTLEYVELALDAPAQFDDVLAVPGVPEGERDVLAFESNNTQASPADPSAVLAWDSDFLGGLDPFAHSKSSSGRNVPHCMPLWYGPEDQPGVGDAEALTIFCNAVGGTFKVTATVESRTGTTKPIAHDASASDVKEALLALTRVFERADIASVAGDLASGVSVRFGGRLARYDLPALTFDSSGLIDGAAYAVVDEQGVDGTAPGAGHAYDTASYLESSGYNDDIFDLELYTPSATAVHPNATYRERVAEIRRWWRDSEFDAEFLRDTFRSMLKALNARWTGEDTRRADEVWNPLTFAQHGTDASRDAVMEMKGEKGAVHVRLKSPLAFEPFDTGDSANYKVTRQPSFSADDVPFKVSREKDARFYLRPQVHVFARVMDFSREEQILYSTYRVFNPISGNWYNDQTLDTGQGGLYAGGAYSRGSITVSPGGDYDGDAGPFTFTVTGTIDRSTGSYSITGLHDGGSVSGDADTNFFGNWEAAYDGPNYSVTIEAEKYAVGQNDETVTMQASTEPAYSSGVFTLNPIQCTLLRGCHVGRYPAMPRNIGSGNWQAPTIELESLTTTYADGTEKTRTFEESEAKQGRQLSGQLFGSGTSARRVYSRRSNRDAKDYLVYAPIPSQSFRADTGNGTVTFLPDSRFEWKKLTDTASTLGELQAEAAQMGAEIKAAILALDHVSVVESYSLSETLSEPDFGRRWVMLPIDAQPGQLCAVIVQGDSKFYIWRKTAEERGGYDADRYQGTSTYSGSIT